MDFQQSVRLFSIIWAIVLIAVYVYVIPQTSFPSNIGFSIWFGLLAFGFPTLWYYMTKN